MSLINNTRLHYAAAINGNTVKDHLNLMRDARELWKKKAMLSVPQIPLSHMPQDLSEAFMALPLRTDDKFGDIFFYEGKSNVPKVPLAPK